MDEKSNLSLSEMESAIMRRRAELVTQTWYSEPTSPAGSPESSAESEWRNPFEAFNADWHPDAAGACAAVREWTYAISRGEARGLLLWSNEHGGQTGYGTGKTTLAGIAYEFLRTVADYRGHTQRATLINAADLFQDIKDAYSKNQPVAPIFDDLTRGHVLLDDWGKQYVSTEAASWARELFYRLIDHLVRNRRGLLVTSNCSPREIEKQIGGASWSRLLGLCGPRGFVDMSAVPDYRLKIGGFVG